MYSSFELGNAATAVAGDVNDDADVSAAIEAARQLGAFSLVVNVAGGATGGGRTVGRDGTPHDKAIFETTMAMNAFGTFNVSRLSAAAMAGNEPDGDGQRGVIVNTASIAGLEGQTGQLAYAAANSWVDGLVAYRRSVGLPAVGINWGPWAEVGGAQFFADLGVSMITVEQGLAAMQLALSADRNPYLNGENIRLDGALRFPPK